MDRKRFWPRDEVRNCPQRSDLWSKSGILDFSLFRKGGRVTWAKGAAEGFTPTLRWQALHWETSGDGYALL